ncbi:uncharacterized protein [Spinacia oleracea]|uniref:Nucleotidyl transferase domain-containing protein n=1 Tax=Spinacia oleracea TaxID=3562 RepID=A0ABM3QGP4_SPIOL|nr:uncharacterized protein LOC110790052 [Spinacia oleracea]
MENWFSKSPITGRFLPMFRLIALCKLEIMMEIGALSQPCTLPRRLALFVHKQKYKLLCCDVVRQFIWLFEDARNKDIENVLIFSDDQLYRMDYMDLVQNHIYRNSDITVSCFLCSFG